MIDKEFVPCTKRLRTFLDGIIGVSGFDYWHYTQTLGSWQWSLLRITKPNFPWIAGYVFFGFCTFMLSWWFVLAWVFSWFLAFGFLPFVSYAGCGVGWHPSTGGFRIKVRAP